MKNNKKEYVKVYRVISKLKELLPIDKLILSHIISFCNSSKNNICFLKNKYFMEELGISSVTTITNSLNKLEKLKLIIKKRKEYNRREMNLTYMTRALLLFELNAIDITLKKLIDLITVNNKSLQKLLKDKEKIDYIIKLIKEELYCE